MLARTRSSAAGRFGRFLGLLQQFLDCSVTSRTVAQQTPSAVLERGENDSAEVVPVGSAMLTEAVHAVLHGVAMWRAPAGVHAVGLTEGEAC